jgi:lipopolysaccharide export LptBFGC system permease protein LptF
MFKNNLWGDESDYGGRRINRSEFEYFILGLFTVILVVVITVVILFYIPRIFITLFCILIVVIVLWVMSPFFIGLAKEIYG